MLVTGCANLQLRQQQVASPVVMAVFCKGVVDEAHDRLASTQSSSVICILFECNKRTQVRGWLVAAQKMVDLAVHERRLPVFHVWPLLVMTCAYRRCLRQDLVGFEEGLTLTWACMLAEFSPS